MIATLDRTLENFEQSFKEFKSSTKISKPQKAAKLASQVDILSRTKKGLEYLLDIVLELESEGIFKETAWDDLRGLTPSLVKGTLLSGHPNSSFEILSELRALAYAQGRQGRRNYTTAEASNFIEETLVYNLEFAFDELTEESRSRLTQQERKKLVSHFSFLLDTAKIDGIKEKLVEEIKMLCEQRPIVTSTVRNLIQTVYQKLELNPENKIDEKLIYYINAVFYPAPIVENHSKFEDFKKNLSNLSFDELKDQFNTMGIYLHNTGLDNPYLAIALRYIVNNRPKLLPILLHLNSSGISEWERFPKFVSELILDNFSEENFTGIYGLKRMLERSLFSRRPVRAGLTNLKLISFHPEIEKRILKSIANPTSELTGKQYLMGALIGILGQPNGVGQGNNATCQSVRGISMWAQHSPAKLINIVTTVVSMNNLIMRFENDDLETLKLSKGLVDKLDHKLDALSVVLVPHLDKIYNEMMKRASGRGEDPHKWANPSLYGQLIPIGFASAYSYLTNSIEDFKGFATLFYQSFHPLYNGGRKMVYPNPIGIYITSSNAHLLGFHAVSLLRIDRTNDGDYRAYFLNPNNEGRQNWGQNIKPTVFGNGERHGESSLPVAEFMSRVYAFHYNILSEKSGLEVVPEGELEKIKKLAEESWGRQYIWNNMVKKW